MSYLHCQFPGLVCVSAYSLQKLCPSALATATPCNHLHDGLASQPMYLLPFHGLAADTFHVIHLIPSAPPCLLPLVVQSSCKYSHCAAVLKMGWRSPTESLASQLSSRLLRFHRATFLIQQMPHCPSFFKNASTASQFICPHYPFREVDTEAHPSSAQKTLYSFVLHQHCAFKYILTCVSSPVIYVANKCCCYSLCFAVLRKPSSFRVIFKRVALLFVENASGFFFQFHFTLYFSRLGLGAYL